MTTEPYSDQDRANEGCCWDSPRDQCPGPGCGCSCHPAPPPRYAQAEKQEAFAAADRYFERVERDVLTPESLRSVARKRNPLFGLFYADGYLEGKLNGEAAAERLRQAGEGLASALLAVRVPAGDTPEQIDAQAQAALVAWEGAQDG